MFGGINNPGDWSLTSLQQRSVKTGGRLVKHARYYWPLLAESHLTRRIVALPVPAGQAKATLAGRLVGEDMGDGKVPVESIKRTAAPGRGVLGRSRIDPLGTAGQAFRRRNGVQRPQEESMMVCSSWAVPGKTRIPGLKPDAGAGRNVGPA
jgi:hypothetical protein